MVIEWWFGGDNCIFSMFIFALIGAISPGACEYYRYRFRGLILVSGEPYPMFWGATIAYTLIVFLVGIGLNEVLLTYPQITEALQYLGGGFLLYMSWKIATAQPSVTDTQIEQKPPNRGAGCT